MMETKTLAHILDEEDDEEIVKLEAKLEAPIQLETGFECHIVVENVPAVPNSKIAKLKNVLTKIFSTTGEIVNIFMPMSKSNPKVTEKYAFSIF